MVAKKKKQSRERIRDAATEIAAERGGADGLFVAKEIGGDTVDLIALFEMHGRAIYDIAQRMVAQSGSSGPTAVRAPSTRPLPHPSSRR